MVMALRAGFEATRDSGEWREAARVMALAPEQHVTATVVGGVYL